MTHSLAFVLERKYVGDDVAVEDEREGVEERRGEREREERQIRMRSDKREGMGAPETYGWYMKYPVSTNTEKRESRLSTH